eukprot:544672-Alexandrium_andersonii.AAC.1
MLLDEVRAEARGGAQEPSPNPPGGEGETTPPREGEGATPPASLHRPSTRSQWARLTEGTTQPGA